MGDSGSVDAKGMCPLSFGMSGGGMGDSDAKLSLVWRSLEFLANDLGFRIELAIRGYHLPSRIILDEATFIRRFECFHLKEIINFNKCFMT